MSQFGYAKILPKLRIALSNLAKTDDIRSLALVENFEEALRDANEFKVLKEEKLEARSFSEVERALNKVIVRYSLKLSKIAPQPADKVAKAYLCTYIIGDLLSIFKRTALGAPISIETLVTPEIPDTPLHGLEEESLETPKQLIQRIKTPEARKFSEGALDTYQRTNDPGIYDLCQPLIRPVLIQSVLQDLNTQSREAVKQVTCPRIIYTLVSGLLYASRTRTPGEIISTVYSGINICKFNWNIVRQTYDNNSNDPEQLYSELKRYFPIFEGKNYIEALKHARSSSLRESRKRSLAQFEGYPFHAGLIAASIELLEHEVRDIRAVLAGKLYEVYPEKIYSVISREL
ncbi:MAG: V-type ATPase subunit [Desulfurococcales archaeon]|nr:V-type ATPase subunit [Desulfurococcales archaeon]